MSKIDFRNCDYKIIVEELNKKDKTRFNIN